MATKRIDIVVYNGHVKVTPVQGYCQLKELENERILITTGSWKIIVDKNDIFINCSSKAVKKQNKFKIATMNGSLFLYNSTNNWYWYFRKKKLQFILDMHKIDAVKICDTNQIELPCCFSNHEGTLSESNLEKSPTLKYFGDNVEIKLDKAHMDIFDDTSSLTVATVLFHFGKFLIVEFLPNHRRLYVDKSYRVERLFSEGYLNTIEVESIIDDLIV
jgi:hypothetical protein